MSDQLSNDLASLKIHRDENPERPRPVRTLLVVAFSLGLLGAGAALIVPKMKAEIYKTEVEFTEVSLISPAQASVTVTSTGYVVPELISKVGAKVTGRLGLVNVKEGAVVKAGDVLGKLEDADQRSAILAAEARVSAARARAQAARANLAEIKVQSDRERALVEKEVKGKASLDDLVARAHSLGEAAKAADADVAAALREVDSLRVGLDDRTIRAPMDGTIVSKPPEAGELMGPQSAGAFELADFRTLRIETDVPETRLANIKIGGPTEIVLDAYPSKRYRGEVVELGSRVNRAKATVVAKVKFVDAMDGVLPDMAARVSFLTEKLSAESLEQKAKTVVPTTAVTERGGRKVVFIVESGKVRAVPVTLGPALASGFELVQGPSPGTRLVANPPPELSDGNKIKDKESTP